MDGIIHQWTLQSVAEKAVVLKNLGKQLTLSVDFLCFFANIKKATKIKMKMKINQKIALLLLSMSVTVVSATEQQIDTVSTAISKNNGQYILYDYLKAYYDANYAHSHIVKGDLNQAIACIQNNDIDGFKKIYPFIKTNFKGKFPLNAKESKIYYHMNGVVSRDAVRHSKVDILEIIFPLFVFDFNWEAMVKGVCEAVTFDNKTVLDFLSNMVNNKKINYVETIWKNMINAFLNVWIDGEKVSSKNKKFNFEKKANLEKMFNFEKVIDFMFNNSLKKQKQVDDFANHISIKLDSCLKDTRLSDKAKIERCHKLVQLFFEKSPVKPSNDAEKKVFNVYVDNLIKQLGVSQLGVSEYEQAVKMMAESPFSEELYKGNAKLSAYFDANDLSDDCFVKILNAGRNKETGPEVLPLARYLIDRFLEDKKGVSMSIMKKIVEHITKRKSEYGLYETFYWGPLKNIRKKKKESDGGILGKIPDLPGSTIASYVGAMILDHNLVEKIIQKINLVVNRADQEQSKGQQNMDKMGGVLGKRIMSKGNTDGVNQQSEEEDTLKRQKVETIDLNNVD